MNYPLQYPKIPSLNDSIGPLNDYVKLKVEYGSNPEELLSLVEEAEKNLWDVIKKINSLEENAELTANEPNSLEEIKSLRPLAQRKLWENFDETRYKEKLKGALLGRFAGCTLGAPVEFWTVDAMKEWAEYIGDQFPPVDYWSETKNPSDLRYGISKFCEYSKKFMNKVPVDDDITYTILGLMIMEDYGPDFSINDVGAAWLKYLPYACTAEDVALKNLKTGMDAMQVADENNPYCQWIGADIRSDPWGYLAPGQPELAAEFAYRDAYISHRRNGIYGEMYFSAVISAAFETDDTFEALKLGLNEIPKECLLAKDVRWALETGKKIKDFMDATKAINDRFEGMSQVHTNLNACATIFGLMIGGDDFDKAISETVSMGYDNDCTAATVGSIFGAAKGFSAINEKWYKPFNNTVLTYINGNPSLEIDNILDRFEEQAKLIYK